MSPPALFFLKIVLDIWGPLKFHMNFRIDFSIYAKKMSLGFFYQDCIESVVTLSSTVILIILSLPIHEHEMSFHLFMSLISFSNVL